MNIETLVVGQFQVNCYILHGACPHCREAVVIDPGDDAQDIITLISDLGVNVTHIFITHGHGDHIGAIGDVKAAFPGAKVCIHPRDAHMLLDPRANLSAAFGMPVTGPPADIQLEGNTEITAADITFSIEHVPGHTPGSICFVPQVEEKAVFTGDTIFAGSVGRTDFPGGNTRLLLSSITDKVLSLPPQTIIYPGHGVATTVAVENEDNPYVGKRAR